MERMAAEESAAAPSAKRIARTKLERRKIVEESLLPGTSVTSVARAHGVRPNQVHHWRRLYKQGLLGAATTTRIGACENHGPKRMPSYPESVRACRRTESTARASTGKRYDSN